MKVQVFLLALFVAAVVSKDGAVKLSVDMDALDKSADSGSTHFASTIPDAGSYGPEFGDVQWTNTAGGRSEWTVEIETENCLNLVVIFHNLNLPKQSSLKVCGEDRCHRLRSNQPYESTYAPPVVQGSKVVVTVSTRTGNEHEVTLGLDTVHCGFRPFLKPASHSRKREGACNNDVACSLSAGWAKQIRSVALYQVTIGGSTFSCTGTLITDDDQSNIPYFMTAYHCGVDSTSRNTVVLYWNFERPTCNGPEDSFNDEPQTGGVIVLKHDPFTDMTLLKLKEIPPNSYKVYYSGWEKATNYDGPSTGIHHPSGDEKAISLNSDETELTFSCIGFQDVCDHMDCPVSVPDSWDTENCQASWYNANDGCDCECGAYDPDCDTNNSIFRCEDSPGTWCNPKGKCAHSHWEVDWEDGTTEPGSSGSALFRDSTGRLIGWLSGGAASCSNPSGTDCYGRMSEAFSSVKKWLGNSNSANGHNPDKPRVKSVKAKSITDKSVKAVWKLDFVKGAHADKFILHTRRRKNGSWTNWSKVGTFNGTKFNKTIKNLKSDTKYEVRVKAESKQGTHSKIKAFTTKK